MDAISGQRSILFPDRPSAGARDPAYDDLGDDHRGDVSRGVDDDEYDDGAGDSDGEES
jgi:hypothetical protein